MDAPPDRIDRAARRASRKRRLPAQQRGSARHPPAAFSRSPFLRDHDGASQQALGEALCIDANNLVLLLNELEAAGFAERRRDPLDRRRHLVDITAAGPRALERAERAQQTIEDDVLGALDPDERATLRRPARTRARQGRTRIRLRPRQTYAAGAAGTC